MQCKEERSNLRTILTQRYLATVFNKQMQGVYKVRNYYVENGVILVNAISYYITVCFLLQNYVLKILFNILLYSA